MDSVKLNDGHSIPQVGLGLWQNTNKEDFTHVITSALEAGYRHFDTAQAYGNERLLGDALKQSSIPRSEIFITTKISVTNFGEKRTARSFSKSLEHLQTDYVDLLLLHFPVTGLRKKSWLELERIQKSGQTRSIGVSNYTVRHLEKLQEYATVIPAVNQVELHVFLQQHGLREFCKDAGIVIEAYSPLAHGKAMDDPVVQAIAKKHSKTYAQVMLRWAV